jgi:hypothetical protein
MHEVLHLPGPGAGIAVVVGPVLVFVALSSHHVGKGFGGAFVGSLAFSLTYVVVVQLFDVSTNPKGAFGSALFVAAAAVFGFATEGAMSLVSARKNNLRFMAVGAFANAVLFAFYSTVIFPRTAGWIDLSDIPLLSSFCLACGIVAGYIAYHVSKPLYAFFSSVEKE